MNHATDLYLPNEERFGFCSSHLYGAFSKVSPMRKFHSFAARMILARNPSSILDIGFGTGDVLKMLCENDKELSIYGVEPSIHMLNVARRKLKGCGDDASARLQQGSSRRIPFQQKFDVIFSSLSFHHWKEPEDSLKNLMAYLNPGGSFLVFEFARESLRGYKRMTASHSLSISDLEKFSGIAKFTVHDEGEHRCVEFRSIQ